MANAPVQQLDPALFPSWVPKEAFIYLMHTELGTPIRALAREAGQHASTVLRQVRGLEQRREDILVDRALNRLGELVQSVAHDTDPSDDAIVLSEEDLSRESRRILRRMSELGAVLAVAVDMDKAVVVHESDEGTTLRKAVVERQVAEALALKGWISCENTGRISRYRITAPGRSGLNRLIAEAENRAVGFAEAQAEFESQSQESDAGEKEASAETRSRRASGRRFYAAETPLTLLARRRDRSGRKFLSDELMQAGERLREDFEMAGLSRGGELSWDRFLSQLDDQPRAEGHQAVRLRVVGALRDLGPGLGDVVLRCCCYLEGLEATEQRMGWSARSGKIVLRIALQRLARYYSRLGEAGALLG